jgi:SAM-dependent methyltransferase
MQHPTFVLRAFLLGGRLFMLSHERYIPALGLAALTPLYDPFLRYVLREATFKHALIVAADLGWHQCILDLGCGTGTLTILIKRAEPAANVSGLDGDTHVLALALAKAAQANVEVALQCGLADALPYCADSFDRVLSSLVLHHLTTEQKQNALREVHRVLRPGGTVHIADFGPPHTMLARPIAKVVHHLERAADNIDGRIIPMLQMAGFDNVSLSAQFMTLFGTVAIYCARKADRR